MRALALAAITIGTSLVSASTVRAEPVSLERTLVRAAPDVLKFCRDRSYRNVGVLKFLVHRDGQSKLSDNVGTLNRLVARRLELGMILANSARDPLGIIDNASDIAAKTPGANHLTREGRLKLFGPKYPLAWGKDQVIADAFITGLVDVSADLKTLTIKLLVFDKSSNKLEPLGDDLIARNDPRKLPEIGESFTRGAFDGGSIETTKADSNAKPTDQSTPEPTKQDEQILAKAEQVKSEATKNPADDPSAPVKLQVLYDGRPAPIDVRDGKAFVPEPNETQKVSFRLSRNKAAGTLACVLKVNGENTLFRQKLPDIQCHRWLLLPDNKEGIEIVGFQQSADQTQAFRVLTKPESKDREIDYGSEVGTITLTVFGEQKGASPPGDLSEETQNTKVVEKAKLPDQKPENFNALTAQLLADANRGLIAEGSVLGRKINLVKFTSDPTPLMSLTVVYYQRTK